MVNRCAFCKSGHERSAYDGSYFEFPAEEKHPELRAKWIKALPVADYNPAENDCKKEKEKDCVNCIFNPKIL